MDAPTAQTHAKSPVEVLPRLPLYEHTKRGEWGLAILAWERGSRRAYQFEDGELRVFKAGYYGFLHEVDVPADRAVQVAAELERKLGNSVEMRKALATGGVAAPDLSLDDQIRIFTIEYPDGFGGDDWRAKKRAGGRRLKRHRDPAIAAAREQLAKERIDDAISRGQATSIRDACAAILATTDLVTKKQLAPLEDLHPVRHAAFASALRDLLWNDDDAYELRFERFVAALTLDNPSAASWQLTTALPALVHPEAHVCVRPATVRRQAAWMAPRLALAKAPTAPLYVRASEMADAVSDALHEHGLEPSDMWDVYDFMVDTLKPAAKKLLEQ